MWAEMKPDCYSGASCDKVKPQWEIHADGDMDSDSLPTVKLSARTFPPGTKITIEEPLCPHCGELREPAHPGIGAAKVVYKGPCQGCGFDWDKWVLETYS
jgi:hypothetical protein